MGTEWWEAPMRAIQTNLQVRDTSAIDPERLAGQIAEADANVLVFNVGGIYAWYETKVPYHTQNPFLPSGRDLLGEVIEQCHRRGIRFVARFDFSKAEDSVYQKRPQWFVRDNSGEPQYVGLKRPGEWSLLLSTCINSQYRQSAVAAPVLDEVLGAYDIDGIFYNNPFYIPCWCSACRREYESRYHDPMPENRELFDKDWPQHCANDHISFLYSRIKSKRPEVPVILYYDIAGEHITGIKGLTDMICTESQDVHSSGWANVPATCRPAMTMKVGRAFGGLLQPFGIIHSAPAMEWRHTGLSTAEYAAWLSQIPANGGTVWHSVTGIPDTIPDRRIMNTVAECNRMTKKVEEHMDGAVLKAETALLWDGSPSCYGWASGLTNRQAQFDVLLPGQDNPENLGRFRLVIVPEEWILTMELAADLKEYVKRGGRLIFEGTNAENAGALGELLGIGGDVCRSEKLYASYIRFEGEGNPLQTGMEETPLIAHRGHVLYCSPACKAQTLATLVPPFSPPDAAGAPPERASILTERTDLPLCLRHAYGNGEAMFLPFSLSKMVNDFRMDEHSLFMANAVDAMLPFGSYIKATFYQGLQVSVFENGKNLLVHLVNECGSRPLQKCIPLHNVAIELKNENGLAVKSVGQLIAGGSLGFENGLESTKIVVPELNVWECLLTERE